VGDFFRRSVNGLIDQQPTGLTDPQKSIIRTEGSFVWAKETKADGSYLTLGTLKSLYDRAVAVVEKNVPRQPPSSHSSASSASSSTSAGVPHAHFSSPARASEESAQVLFHPSPQPPTYHQSLDRPVPPTIQALPPPKPAARDTKSKASAPSFAGVSMGDLPEQARPCFQKLAQDYQTQKAGSKTEAQIAHHVQRLKELVAFAYGAWPEGFKPSASVIPRAVQFAANTLEVSPGSTPPNAFHMQLSGDLATRVFKKIPTAE
jgi:hypothetical protein